MDIVLVQLLGVGGGLLMLPILCVVIFNRLTACKPCVPYSATEFMELQLAAK